MNIGLISLIVLGGIVVLVIAIVVIRRLPRRLKVPYFQKQWKTLQTYCKDKATWPLAITEADRLLEVALKKRKFKGKSMGERMVSAQRIMTNNDGMWFAHNLYKKVKADPNLALRESDVKTALIGFRQALKDIGAFGDGESRSS